MKPYDISTHLLSIETTFRNRAYIILHHTLTRSDCYLPRFLWERIKKKDPALACDAVLKTLREQGFLVPAGMDPFDIFLAWRSDLARDYTTIKSRVLVTRECNNDCRYCVAPKRGYNMSPQTALLMDRFYCGLIHKKGAKKVKDVYLGGEPLLNMKVLTASIQRRFFFCRGRDIPYSFSITTNGRNLTPSLVGKLLPFGLERLHVSISGPADVHNRLRPSKSGDGHYHEVMGNLSKISGMVPIVIEYQYDTTQKDYLRFGEMLWDFRRLGIGIADVGVTLILPRREDNLFTGGPGDVAPLLFLHHVLLESGFPVYREPPSMGCMADLKGYLVFDTDGSILPCVALDPEEMAYGNVTDGIDYVAETGMLNRRFPGKCRTCALLPCCMGGCRLQALTAGEKDFNGVYCNYDHLKATLEAYMRHKAAVEMNKSTIADETAAC